MARALLLKRPSLLAYPGLSPGFDPSHPAAKGISNGKGLSAVSVGGNFVSLLNGAPFAITSTPTAAISPTIGTVTKFASATTQAVSLVGQSTAAQTQLTFAAVVQFDGLASLRQDLINDGSTVFGLTTSHSFELLYNGTSHGILAATNNIPYFIAGSVLSGVGYSYVVVNLQNGKILINGFTASATTLVAPTGTLFIGNNGGAQPTIGGIAAVMYAPTFLSAAQLLAWAQDPWAFWYPRQFDLSMMLKTSSGAGTRTATLLLMGIG